jgi:hypothetical protein
MFRYSIEAVHASDLDRSEIDSEHAVSGQVWTTKYEQKPIPVRSKDRSRSAREVVSDRSTLLQPSEFPAYSSIVSPLINGIVNSVSSFNVDTSSRSPRNRPRIGLI